MKRNDCKPTEPGFYADMSQKEVAEVAAAFLQQYGDPSLSQPQRDYAQECFYAADEVRRNTPGSYYIASDGSLQPDDFPKDWYDDE